MRKWYAGLVLAAMLSPVAAQAQDMRLDAFLDAALIRALLDPRFLFRPSR